MASSKRLTVTAVLLTVTGIFVASNIYTLIPIYDDIAVDFSTSSERIVLGSSLFTLLYAIGLLYFGPASDRFGRRKVILLGLFASAASTFAVSMTNDVTTLYVARAIQGLTLGSFAPVAFAYTFDLYSFKPRTLLLVCINAGFLMAGMLGQLISSYLADVYFWQTVYWFFAAGYAVLFLISLIVLPKLPLIKIDTQPSTFAIFKKLLLKPLLLKCYAITFTLLLSFVAFYDGISRFLAEDEVFVLRAAGLIGTVLALVTGKVIGRFGLRKTLQMGIGLAIMSILMLMFFKQMVVLTILSIFFVSAIAILIPCMITYIGGLGGEQKAKALSLYSFVLVFGASFASPLAAALNFQSLLYVLLGLFVVGGWIARGLVEGKRR